MERLKAVPYVTIATDTDTAGQALAEELARRIGKDKCRVATFAFKDLNEAFLDSGADIVKGIIDSAEPYPVAGLSSANKYLDRLNDLWGKGNGKGSKGGKGKGRRKGKSKKDGEGSKGKGKRS